MGRPPTQRIGCRFHGSHLSVEPSHRGPITMDRPPAYQGVWTLAPAAESTLAESCGTRSMDTADTISLLCSLITRHRRCGASSRTPERLGGAGT